MAIGEPCGVGIPRIKQSNKSSIRISNLIGIYKTTNKVNGKVYIGQSKDIKRRWKEHISSVNKEGNNIVLYKAMRKHGVDDFNFEVVETCCEEELNERERYYIKLYNSMIPNGYNMNLGGNSFSSFGEDNCVSKLTNSQVYDIRERYKNGERKQIVYQDYKDIISINTFADIWIGKTWPTIHTDVYTNENKEKHRHMSTSSYHCSVLTEDDVLFLRDCKNSGKTKMGVYNEHFSNININTFNDAWNGVTFKHIQSAIKETPAKKEDVYKSRSGSNNVNASVSESTVKEIRRRRDNGESLRIVHRDYKEIERHVFSNIWHDRTYKNV